MDATVINRFQDKHTGRIYNPGETYSGDAERISELVKGGWVSEPKRKPKKRK